MVNIKDEISIVLAGEAGQGIQSIETILAKVLKNDGFNIFSTKEYMSRVRGGINSTEIRVSSKRVDAFLDRIDILIVLNQDGIEHLKNRISDKTIVFGEKEKIKYEGLIDIPFSEIASGLGNILFSNTVAVGLICGLLNVNPDVLKNFIIKQFGGKSPEIQEKNITAGQKGYEIGKDLGKKEININIQKTPNAAGELMLSGADAVALGALAGGCNYVCAYPMSPSTSVLVAMADFSKEMDVLVEQVEDEVGVINMALGAWYAGARALVTTSGGGFALMTEGMSLAGMIETPLVVHLAQRPGPATGLPTRTEQGDLNLALYAGHGEFPRVIYAPGTLEEAFYLTQKSFQIADRYQVPVIILTDQFFVDSYYNTPEFKVSGLKIEKYIIETKDDYKRYQFGKTGVSPRGIPGFGSGIVCVDSDEHDQSANITEDLDMRKRMVDKRLSKFDLIKKDIIGPALLGNKNYETLIISWGSTYSAVKEALEILNKKELAFLHFSQVFPLSDSVKETLLKAKKIILVENNASGQFGQLLKLKFGINIDESILKYNGIQFSVEELADNIKEKL